MVKKAIRLTDTRFVNPFNAQGPTNPKYYANREDLLSTFIQNARAVSGSNGVTRPINITVMGSWGVGKTSTLLKFKDILKKDAGKARTFSACVSLKPTCCVDADTFFATIMENVFREYESTVELPKKVLDFVKDELNLIDKWKITKISLNPEIERQEAPLVKGINFKGTMMKFWEKLHSGGIDLAVIMLDDIHYTLLHGNADLLLDLRTDMQALSSSGAQYMFIITGPSNLYPEIRDKAEPFTRLFERFELKPFDIGGTRQLVKLPLEVEGIDMAIDESVIQRIHQITGGHPYFITLIMQDLLYNVQNGRLDSAGFDKLCPGFVGHFARVKFDDDLGRASGAEKRVLFEMAAIDDNEVAPSGLKGRGTTMLLDRLVKKDLVVKVSRGKYQLYNPLFKAYLKKVKT